MQCNDCDCCAKGRSDSLSDAHLQQVGVSNGADPMTTLVLHTGPSNICSPPIFPCSHSGTAAECWFAASNQWCSCDARHPCIHTVLHKSMLLRQRTVRSSMRVVCTKPDSTNWCIKNAPRNFGSNAVQCSEYCHLTPARSHKQGSQV